MGHRPAIGNNFRNWSVMGGNPKCWATSSGESATNDGLLGEGVRFQRCTLRTRGLRERMGAPRVVERDPKIAGNPEAGGLAGNSFPPATDASKTPLHERLGFRGEGGRGLHGQAGRQDPEDLWERKMADWRMEEPQMKMALQGLIQAPKPEIGPWMPKRSSAHPDLSPTPGAADRGDSAKNLRAVPWLYCTVRVKLVVPCTPVVTSFAVTTAV
jgi:hypothetical protein